MKKFIYMIIFAAAFSACSKAPALAPAISLFSGSPEILDETAIFRLATANMPDSTERIFPVTFGGSAERGIDYEVSADAFVFGGESPVDSIIVTTLKFGTEKTVSMTVGLPEGMEGGRYLTSEYQLHDNPAYITFDYGYRISTGTISVQLKVTDKDGVAKNANQDIGIDILIDKEKSTAEENIDFEFSKGLEYTIQKGKSNLEFQVKNLKPVPEGGRDRIVLSLSHDPRYGKGGFSDMEIVLMDSKWDNLDGEWAVDTLITDAEYMESYWGGQCSGYDLLPKFNSYDAVRFDLTKCILDPFFISGLEHYFIDDSYFKKGPEHSISLTDGSSVGLQTFLLDNTNRYFSKDQMSEDKESYIGVRILEGGEEAADTLDFYIIDYVSRSFMPELEKGNKYAPEKPVAASPGQYLNMRFIK